MEDLQKKLLELKKEIMEIEAQINLNNEYVCAELVKYQNVMLECNGIKILQIELSKLKKQIEDALKNGENEKSPNLQARKVEFKRKLNKFKIAKEEYEVDVKAYETYLREVRGESELKETLSKKQKEVEKIQDLIQKETFSVMAK